MPRPALRSRSYRKMKVRTPGGKLVDRYLRRKPKQAKCSGCKKPLSGVPRERPYKIKGMAKTVKRPERMFGGELCSACTRKRIKELKVYKEGL